MKKLVEKGCGGAADRLIVPAMQKLRYRANAVCEKCWAEHWPDRIPIRMKAEYVDEGPCHFCGVTTRSGIFTRVEVVEDE